MKIFSLFLLSCFALSAHASTSITTPTVSGHWTLAGSPYLIYNDIAINSGQSLKIDPGVEIIFQGSYRLNVNGILSATGTLSQQINFHVNDTTGFSTITTSATGGWHGIQFQTYSGTSIDTSELSYCNVSYTKFDSADYWTFSLTTLWVRRSLKIRNCNFSLNRNPIGGSPLFDILTSTGEVFDLENCNISNNFSETDIFNISNLNGGSSIVLNNVFSNNTTVQNSIINCAFTNMLFANNKIYQNAKTFATAGSAILFIVGNTVTLKGNYLYNNTSEKNAVLLCGGGYIDIIGNYICNNLHTSGTCGITDGGGALNLSSGFAVSLPADSTFYNIRNNIIANNYSPFEGGSIKIYNAKASIENNHFINNKSVAGASIYINISTLDTLPLIIKNNIFYGNVRLPDSSSTSPNMQGYTIGSIEYDHNWSQHSSYFDMYLIAGFHLLGDTTTNIIGTNPGLIAPTLTADVTDDAMSANFRLLPTSHCINKGDITGIVVDSFDYWNNVRIYGTSIDIGACEFNPTEFATTATINNSNEQKNISAYPNPASNILFISTTEPKGTIELQNISGKLTAEKTVTNTLTSFDIHTLPRGIYFATWNDGNGEKSVQKIVIE